MRRDAGVLGICFAQQVDEPAASSGSSNMDSSRELQLSTQLAHLGPATYRKPTYTSGQYEGPAAWHHNPTLLLHLLSVLQESSRPVLSNSTFCNNTISLYLHCPIGSHSD